MFFSSYSEFGVILLFIIVYTLVRLTGWNIPKKGVLFVGNFVVLQSLVEWETYFAHMVICGWVYVVSRISLNWPAARRKWVTGVTIGVLIVFFIIRNYDIHLSFLQRIGVSYILFRHIQFLVDVYAQKIRRFSFIDYVNFILFFPNFLSGPIDTFINFQRWNDESWNQKTRELVVPGIAKIGIGAIKKFGIVPVFMVYALDYHPLASDYGMVSGILLSLMAYSMYIYFDFSGYSDIAIGTGYLLGVKTPENFRSPYLSSDLSAFWQRWHMTFSLFLRNNIFKPTLQLINTFMFSKPRLLVSSLGYIVTFVICGLWHGNTMNFVYWGLWHGIGLVLLKLYGKYMKPEISGVVVKIYDVVMIAVTFMYVTIGWAFFHYSQEELIEIFHALWM